MDLEGLLSYNLLIPFPHTFQLLHPPADLKQPRRLSLNQLLMPLILGRQLFNLTQQFHFILLETGVLEDKGLVFGHSLFLEGDQEVFVVLEGGLVL